MSTCTYNVSTRENLTGGFQGLFGHCSKPNWCIPGSMRDSASKIKIKNDKTADINFRVVFIHPCICVHTHTQKRNNKHSKSNSQ